MHQINLLPAYLKPKAQAFNVPKNIGPGWIVALLVIYVVSSIGYSQLSMHSKRKQIALLESEDQELLQKLAPLREKMDVAEKRNQRLASMQTILNHKSGWSETFKEFSLLLPQGVWFTGLSGVYSDTPRKFLVKGEALSQVKMADFFEKLERSKLFGETAVVFSEREPNVQPEIYRFELSVSIKDVGEDGPS
jgi:Tfp pilus assembly protein PilN